MHSYLRVVAVVYMMTSSLIAQNGAAVRDGFAERCIEGSSQKKAAEIFAAKNYSQQWESTTKDEISACETCFDVAEVWRNPSGTLVRLSQSSESGDWSRVTEYCFDANARVTRALLNFNYLGDWGVFARYTVRDDRFVETTKVFRNLRTWASIRQPELWSSYREAHGILEPYLTIGKLPFAAMLKRKP